MFLNPGILCGIIAMLAFGISDGLAKAPSQKLHATTFICYRNGIVSLLLLGAFFVLPLPFTFSLHYALIALAIGAAGYIPLATFYAALARGKTGVVTPIANASVLFTVLFSMFFFSERLTTQQTIALVMIIAGIIAVSINFRDVRSSHLFTLSSGIPYALVTCIMWGIVFFLFRIPVAVLGPILTSLLIEFAIFLCSLLHLMSSSATWKIAERSILAKVILVAVLGAIALAAYAVGILYEKVSIVSALAFASPVVALGYAKLVHKEKLSKNQLAAVLMLVTGIVLISM